MAYAVVYGADRNLRRMASATECLGLVKSLQGQGESNIQILDDFGSEIKLVELEKRHRNEVESKFLVERKNEKPGSRMEGPEQLARTAKALRPEWRSTALYLTITFPITGRIAVCWLREKFARKETL